MVTTQAFQFPSSDGVHQIAATWWTPEGAPKAVLQLVHGISEYIGRYDGFARYLAAQGWAVVGHDHLGHGHTARDKEGYGWFADRDGWRYVGHVPLSFTTNGGIKSMDLIFEREIRE